MKVCKSNIKLNDSYNNPIEVKEGYWLKHNLKEDNIWSEEEIKSAFEKFKDSDFGSISEFEKNRNDKHIANEKGSIVGVYPKDDDEYNDLIISYDPKSDKLYLLSRWEYENHPISWEGKVEKNEKVLYDPEHDIRGEKDYKEEGRQLNKSQREQFRNQLAREAHPEHESESANKYIGIATAAQIEAVKKAVETGLSSKGKDLGLPEGFVETLKKLADDHDVSYEDIIEKLAERIYVHNDSLYPRAYNNLLKNIDKPYFFADSKKIKDSAEALVVVKEGKFRTTPESDIKIAGFVNPKGLWKNFADELEIEKEDIKVEYIGSSNKEDYYKVECKFDDEVVKDSSAKCDRCGREIDEDEETYNWGELNLCEECHSDLFDSKSIKDMLEPISSFKEFNFMDKTSQGFEIIHAYRDLDDDRMHVIVYRPKMEDYVIGLGYSPEDGTWNQGIYDLKSATDAEDVLKEDYRVELYQPEEVKKETNVDDVYLEDARFNPRPDTVGWSIIPEDDDTIGELRSKFLNQFVPYLVSNNIIDEEDADKFKASPSQNGYLMIEFPIKYNKEVKEEIKSFFNREISPVDLYYMTYKGIASKLVNAHKYSPATKAEKEDFINKHKDILIEMSKLGFKLDTPASLLESVYNNMALKKYPHQHANDSTDLSEILSLGIKLGFNTLSDIDRFSKSHGNVTDKELLEALRKEVEKMENNEEANNSEDTGYYLGFEAEDDFDLFDSTQLNKKINVKFTGDVTDELAVRDALGKAANQVLNIREAEGEVDIEMMDPDDWYEIKFNRIWVEDKDGNKVGDHYKPVRVKKYFRK